jgi:hypothetical protein
MKGCLAGGIVILGLFIEVNDTRIIYDPQVNYPQASYQFINRSIQVPSPIC